MQDWLLTLWDGEIFKSEPYIGTDSGLERLNLAFLKIYYPFYYGTESVLIK